jgi:hypothetical protein
LNETVDIFVLNVTDPVEEFWERKALQQSPGVRLTNTVYGLKYGL